MKYVNIFLINEILFYSNDVKIVLSRIYHFYACHLMANEN